MNLFSLYAKIGLDTSEYDSGIKSAQSKAKGLASSLGSAMGTGVSAIGKGVGLAVKGITAATAAAGTAITALGAIGLNYNSQMETYTTNFEVMLGSQEVAAKKVEELKTMAAKTPFEMADLAKGTQTLLAFNVASEDTTDVLSDLGDISLGNSEKLDSLTRAYGKMNAAQKVTLEDINMMIDAGYNPLLNIQEKTGESMEELYDRISAGEVSFTEIQEAISAATSEGGQFYQGMEKASQTTAGLISTLKDNAQALVGEVFQPISASLTSTLLPAAIGAIDQLTTAFQTGGVQGMITAASEIISNALATFTAQLPQFLTVAMQLVQTLGAGIMQNMPVIVESAVQTFMAFLNMLVQMAPQLANAALQMIMMLGQSLLANLPQIVDAAVEIFLGFVDTLIEWLPELVPLAFKIVTKLATSLIENIPVIAEKVVELGAAVVDAIMKGISDAWNGLVEWFNGLWDGLFGNKTANVTVNKTVNETKSGVDGSHASGLNYVPFDGYIAELHKGEMVVPAAQASALRSGGYGPVYITVNAAKGQSEEAIADFVMKKMQRQTQRRSAALA